MPEEAKFLAIDLGAESGRALLGRFDGERVVLEEVHRFPNVPVRVTDGLHWDALRLMGCVYRSLSKAAREAEQIESVGIDSWGVDFALLDRDGALVSNPYHHRDPRTEGMVERAFEKVSKEEIYETTGVQFMRINTLYQLLATQGSTLLEVADTLLLIPDLMNYWLTGEKTCEFTNATTTQLYDLEAEGWAEDLLQKMSLPDSIFPKIVPPATKLGSLLPEVAREVGLDAQPPVVAVASHDTASAVVAVPAEGDEFAYISSGTWSLVGVETAQPVVTQEAMDANFTNEGGFGGRTRFLKNVMGLWLLQECRRIWAQKGQEYSYEELAQFAEEAPASGPLVDPDHASFLAPGDMPLRIKRFCEATDQRPPEEVGQIARCIFESLALKYQWVVTQAGEIAGQNVEAIHIVGGGSQNSLLCQFTADATRLPVLAGPVEATALGNVMVQAYARGHVRSLEEIRDVVRRSTDINRYTPGDDAAEWDELRGKFSSVMGASLTVEDLEGG
jgi:rhamnulokinase